MSALLLDGFEVDPAQWAQIETYEGTPLTGDLTWTKNTSTLAVGSVSNSTVTVTSTTSHVTQGSKTWRFQGTVGVTNPTAICNASPYNLSGYSFLFIDANIVTNDAGTYNALIIGDGTTLDVANSLLIGPGFTGAVTAYCALYNSSLNLSSIYFSFICSGSSGATDYYLDNLWANKLYYSSTLDWGSYNAFQKVTRTTSNATQGTYSWEISADTSLGPAGIIQTNTVDVTGYTHIKVDLTAVTTATGDIYELYVTDGTYAIFVDSSTSFTGSTTLDVDLTTEPSFDKTITQIYVIIYSSGSGGLCLFRVDNLRADTGTAAPIKKTLYKASQAVNRASTY